MRDDVTFEALGTSASSATATISRSSIRAGDHIPALEGLRGVAAALVLMHHFTIYGGMRPTIAIDRVFYQIVQMGWWGVDLFFVLSGFLITGILLDAKGGQRYFRSFYARRALRIFPLYYGVLIGVFLILPHLAPDNPRLHSEVEAQGWYWTYLTNVRTAREGWPPLLAIGHFWSLAVEEQFYLLWPAIVFLVNRRVLGQLCIALIIASLLVRIGLALSKEEVAAFVLLPARMDALAIGGFLATAARAPEMWNTVRRWTPVVGTVAAAGLVIILLRKGTLNSEHSEVVTFGLTLTVAFSAALLVSAVAAAPEHPVRRALEGRAFRFLGRYSYGLYVFHHLLVFTLAGRVLSVAQLPRIAGSQIPAQLLFYVVATTASLALSLFSWYCLERPFLRLKRFFPYQYRSTVEG